MFVIITEWPLSALIAEHGTLDEQRVDTTLNKPPARRVTRLYCTDCSILRLRYVERFFISVSWYEILSPQLPGPVSNHYFH
jgi:hypothetical protein